MLEELSNRAIIGRLFKKAEDAMKSDVISKTDWRERYQAIQALPMDQKMVYLIVVMNQQVTSGGFDQYYGNSYGIVGHETAHCLQLIEAKSSAHIMEESLRIMNPDNLPIDALKDRLYGANVSDDQHQDLHQLDFQYDGLEGKENLEDLLGSYLRTISSSL